MNPGQDLNYHAEPHFFLSVRLSPELLPVLGPLERYKPTLDTALLCSSRAGSDLGCMSVKAPAENDIVYLIHTL